MKEVKLEEYNIIFKNFGKLTLIAGPCVIEDYDTTFLIAKTLKEITQKLDIQFIFKASFDKANRSSIKSYRGPGLKKGIQVLGDIKEKLNIPITTDIHESYQAEYVKDVVDIIQIPAFLSRQTDLLKSAALTGKIVNIKKAQFMSGNDMKNVIEKTKYFGNDKILLTERGTMFGYNNLVVDFRNMLIMREFGYPVVYDATHSLQRPSGMGTISGGDREFIPHLIYATAGMGINIFFMEVHPEPEKAKSDPATSYWLDKMENLLSNIKKLWKTSLSIYT